MTNVRLGEYLITRIENYKTNMQGLFFTRSKQEQVLDYAKRKIQELASWGYQSIKPSVGDLENAILEFESSSIGKKLNISEERREKYLSKEIYESLIRKNEKKGKEISERIGLLKEIFHKEFDFYISALAEKLSLTQEHSVQLKKTELTFASERLRELEESQKPKLRGQQYGLDLFSRLTEVFGKIRIDNETRFLKNSIICYFDEKNAIVVGIPFENEIIDWYQKNGKNLINLRLAAYLSGEIGHSIVKLCRDNVKTEEAVSPSIGEFYDGLCQMIQLEINLRSCKFDKTPEDIRRAVFSAFSESARFFEYWLENKQGQSIDNIIESFKKEERTISIVDEEVVKKDYKKYGEPVHEGGCYILTKLIEELKNSNTPEEDIIFPLANLAGKALYDSKTDFSDSLNFISCLRRNNR